MKKQFALITAAVMLTVLAGCGNASVSTADPTEPASATLQVEMSPSCKSVPLTDDPDFSNPNYAAFGNKVVLQGWKQDGAPTIGLYDLTTGTLVKTTIPRDAFYTELSAFDFRDGRLTVIVSYGDEEFTGYRWSCLVFDENLQPIETHPLPIDIDPMQSILDWRVLSDGAQIFLTTDGCYLYDEQNGKRQVSDDSQGRIVLSPDETVWLVRDNGTPKRLDRETLTLEPLQMDDLPKQNFNNGGYYDGFGEYALLCTDRDALYGLQPDTGEKTELVNFADSDLVEARGFAPLPDGRMLASMYDCLAFHSEVLLLTPRTQEEIDSIHTVTLAALQFDQETQTRIARFNRQADGYRLVLKSYYHNDPTENYEQCFENYRNDLLAGNVPDIMLIGDDYRLLSNKGLFEDMRPWMENDPDFHEEDYMMNVLEAGSYKGRIERIPWSFSVSCFIAKKQYIGDRTNLSPTDIYALDLPEEMEYLYNPFGRTTMFGNLQHQIMGNFVDYENAQCSFDSEEFISLLKLVNTVPQGKVPEDDYCYRDDRVLLATQNISKLDDYHMNHQIVFGNQDITLCGIGCDGGTICPFGGIAVSAQSKEKEAAWEFIKFNLREGNQYFGPDSPPHLLPLNRKALEKTFADATIPHDEHHTAYFGMNGQNVEYDAATQEELQTVLAYLDTLHTGVLDDSKLTNIVREESGKYFSGDCTAEEAAKAIQGRAELYLAEQQ